MDHYFWFYVKNIGLPYLLILLALCERAPKGQPVPEHLRQNRLIACGAFLIYLIAEFILFVVKTSFLRECHAVITQFLLMIRNMWNTANLLEKSKHRSRFISV